MMKSIYISAPTPEVLFEVESSYLSWLETISNESELASACSDLDLKYKILLGNLVRLPEEQQAEAKLRIEQSKKQLQNSLDNKAKEIKIIFKNISRIF
jgi:hypothetical protein